MASNAEILAQLEKLSKQMPVIKVLKEPLPVVPRQHGAQFPRSHELENVDVPAILAAVRRWIKIEEAAKRFYWANRLEGEAKGAQLPRDRIIDAECATMSAVSELTAALKEGKRGGGGE